MSRQSDWHAESVTSHARERLAEQQLLVLLLGSWWLLLGVTSRLWIGASPLPRIPWIPLGWLTQSAVEWISTGMLGILLAIHLAWLSGRISDRSMGGASAVLWGAVLLLDQNRLQVWAWQFWILLLTYALFPAGQRLAVTRSLAISIYFFSAVSKLDLTFLKDTGPQLLRGLFRALQLEQLWHPEQVGFLAWGLPLGELLIVALLLLPGAGHRRWGWRLAWLMHLALLLTLGPLGLGHHAGVLCWNLYFLLQNLLLYRAELAGPSNQDSAERAAPPLSLSIWNLHRGWMLLLVTYPALNWMGWCDPWPAWVVYSEQLTRVVPLVHVEAVQSLPAWLQPHVGEPAPLSDWAPVNLDAAAFELLRAPLYPQAEYRGAVWLASSRLLPDDAIQLRIVQPPARWRTERRMQSLTDRQSISNWVWRRWANTGAYLAQP